MDVWQMFEEFNRKYFWEKLNRVRVTWSPNMTLCAGKTVYKSRGKSSWCAIRLSQPLLSQRPHSDTIDTLLHEMIHAYLHVTQGNKYRDSHGPEFRSHMHRINKAQGSKIKITHNFRKEVDKFRVHVYRCDGPCVTRRPFYGILRRAILRPPGPEDKWYQRHLDECGGTFHKISGPGVKGEENGGPGSGGGTWSSGGACGENNDKRRGRGRRNSGGTCGESNDRRGQGRRVALGQRVQPASSQYTSNSPSVTSTQAPSDEYYQPGKVRVSHYNSKPSPSKPQPQFSPHSIPQASTSGIDFDEGSVVERIKSKYANTKQSILLSPVENKQAFSTSIQRQQSSFPLEVCAQVDGRMNHSYIPKNQQNLNFHEFASGPRKGKSVPLEVCGRVCGRMNYSYIPKNLQNLNIHKYIRRYKEAVGASHITKPAQVASTPKQAYDNSAQRRGKSIPLKVCGRVDGKMNYSYIPKNLQNLNIHKYLRRHKEYVSARQYRSQSSQNSSPSQARQGCKRDLGHASGSVAGSEVSVKREHTSKTSPKVGHASGSMIGSLVSVNRENMFMISPEGFHVSGSLPGSEVKMEHTHLISPEVDENRPVKQEFSTQSQSPNTSQSNTSYVFKSSIKQELQSPSPSKSDSDTSYTSPSKSSTKCPVCGTSMALAVYDRHVEECFGSEMDFDMDFLDEVDLETESKATEAKKIEGGSADGRKKIDEGGSADGRKKGGGGGLAVGRKGGSEPQGARNTGGMCGRGDRNVERKLVFEVRGKSGSAERNRGRSGAVRVEEGSRDRSRGELGVAEGGRVRSGAIRGVAEGSRDRGGPVCGMAEGKRDRSGASSSGFVSGGVWGEWETMDCPNCGSSILVAEKDFHLQFCVDSDDDDDDDDEDLDFYKNSRRKTPNNNINGGKGQPKMASRSSKSSNSEGKSKISPSKHPHNSQDRRGVWDGYSEDPDFVTCPSCMERVEERTIHEHLNQCLSFLSEDF